MESFMASCHKIKPSSSETCYWTLWTSLWWALLGRFRPGIVMMLILTIVIVYHFSRFRLRVEDSILCDEGD